MTGVDQGEALAALVGRLSALENELTRSIIGINNRTGLEAYDIMHDRIVRSLAALREHIQTNMEGER